MRQKYLSLSNKALLLTLVTTSAWMSLSTQTSAQSIQFTLPYGVGVGEDYSACPTFNSSAPWGFNYLAFDEDCLTSCTISQGQYIQHGISWTRCFYNTEDGVYFAPLFINPTGGDGFGRMVINFWGGVVRSGIYRGPSDRNGNVSDNWGAVWGTWQGSGHKFRYVASAWLSSEGQGLVKASIEVVNAPMVSLTSQPTVYPFDIAPYVRRGKIDPREFSVVPLSWSSTSCGGHRGLVHGDYYSWVSNSPHSDTLRYRYELEIKRNGQPFDSRSHEERVSWSWYEDASTKDLPPLNGSYSIPLGLAQMGSRYSITLKVRLVHDGYYDNFYAYAGSVSLFERTYTAEFLVSVPADIDNSGCVDDADLLAVLFAFGSSGSDLPEDVDGNGIVDDADLLTVLFDFGLGC